MLDEAELIAAAASGDSRAFRRLYEEHRDRVARLAYRLLGGHFDLEDVVQEVFVQAYRSLPEFRGQSKFGTWLHRVTVNVALMHRRAARSRPVFTEAAPDDRVAAIHDPLPDEDVERRDRLRAFARLLDRLADKKRVVFILHDLEGVAPADIARIVGAPVLTVRTRLFYARREIEAMLGDEPSLAGIRVALSKAPGVGGA
jgi:RNA polymerase sigma-70 factor (ECF subfamily)